MLPFNDDAIAALALHSRAQSWPPRCTRTSPKLDRGASSSVVLPCVNHSDENRGAFPTCVCKLLVIVQACVGCARHCAMASYLRCKPC